MEQTFILKRYGNFSLFEQNLMTAEERKWYITRIKRERENETENPVT